MTEKRESWTRRKRRRADLLTIFVGGRQTRVRRPQTIDGTNVEAFILLNADPIRLHRNELWQYMAVPAVPSQDGSEQEETGASKMSEDISF